MKFVCRECDNKFRTNKFVMTHKHSLNMNRMYRAVCPKCLKETYTIKVGKNG